MLIYQVRNYGLFGNYLMANHITYICRERETEKERERESDRQTETDRQTEREIIRWIDLIDWYIDL